MTTAERFDGVAMLVQRLAVLTAAGIPPLSAWRHALAGTSADATAARVAAAVDSAHELPHAIAAAARDGPAAEHSAWSALAAVWIIAAEAGAPLGPALDRSAGVLRALAQSARDVEVALAGPTATSRVVLALPGVGVVLGALLGFDLLRAFVSVPGAVCLGAGGLLIVAGMRWSRRLLRWARDVDATPGLGFELYAIALSGGTSTERAAVLISSACAQTGVAEPRAEVQGVLDFARSAGVPVVALLRAEADDARRRAAAMAADRAARLETRLLLPLGLCVLPAFVLIGVVPVGLAILSSTADAL